MTWLSPEHGPPMPLRLTLPRDLAAGLLILTTTALGVLWLLNHDNFSYLEFTRTELSALPRLDELRQAMARTIEDQLDGSVPSPAAQDQALAGSKTAADRAKAIGDGCLLILDPVRPVFYPSYLITLDLPERLARETELAVLESRGTARRERGSYLLQTLGERLAGETRAVTLAGKGADGFGAQALAGQDRERRELFLAYHPGDKAALLAAIHSDLRLWQLCGQALAQELHGREAQLVRNTRLRQAAALAILALAFTALGQIVRRANEARHADALNASLQSYQILFEAIPVAAFVYDLADRRFVTANPAAAALLGMPVAELIGTELAAMIPPPKREAFVEDLKRRDPLADTHDFQKLMTRDGRPVEVEVHARHIQLKGRGLRLVLLTDVTADRESQRQLLRFERLAAIGQTAAGLAHEVRNPLAVIAARAEFLKMQLQGQASLVEDLDSILRQGERLKALVHDVLERAGAEDLKFEEAPAGELLGRALQGAKVRFGPAGDGVSVAWDLPPEGPVVYADLAQMERVLTNLILNALQAMGPTGVLTLTARATGSGTELEVADSGPGIPEERLAKIFDPFFTTKATGSGLGLWICKTIVEQHAGRLTARNLKPAGSSFSVLLPPKGGMRP